MSLFLIIAFYAVSAFALPTGTYEYAISSNPSSYLSLPFSGLTGTIEYELWLETESTTSGAWDAYYMSFWEQESGGNIIKNFGGIYFNGSDNDWRTDILNDPLLSGDGWLRLEVQDHGAATNPVAYVRNFNHAPVPEPATLLLLGAGLVGIVGFGRKKIFKK